MIEVDFEPVEHIYPLIADKSILLDSVTTIIHKYSEPFDGRFWTQFKAYEAITIETFGNIHGKLIVEQAKTNKWYKKKTRSSEGLELFISKHPKANQISVKAKELEQLWKENNKERCDFGTNYHEEKELADIKAGTVSLEKFGINTELPVYAFNMQLDLNNLKPGLYPELRVYLLDELVCGTIDRPFILPNKEVFISDHKTNLQLKFENKYSKMLYPLNHLDDCNWNHYRIQLSFYGYMLECYGYKPIGFAIEYFDTIYPFDYMRDEVIAMLKHYKEHKKPIKNKITPEEML